jgi:hypothetical protein
LCNQISVCLSATVFLKLLFHYLPALPSGSHLMGVFLLQSCL